MVSFFTSAKQLGLVVVIVIGLTSAACQRTADSRTTGELSTTTPSSDCRTVPHLIGETEICGQPKNMVALGSPALELLLALDMQPVAYGDHFAPHQGSYDAPAQQIPYLGSQVTGTPINVGSAFSPSIEAIVKAQPDLILATEYSEAEYPALSALAPTLILPWFDSDENLRTLAQLVGRPEQAEQLIAKRQQQIKTAREDFSAVVQAYPEVLALGTSNFPNLSLMTESNGFCASLVAELGFQLVYPADTDGTDPAVIPSVSIEILPQLNQADSIMVFGHNPNPLNEIGQLKDHHLTSIEQTWGRNAIAQSLTASQTERVYFIPTYLCLGLPGPIGTELYLNELKQQMLTND